jgi:la-related protein 1
LLQNEGSPIASSAPVAAPEPRTPKTPRMKSPLTDPRFYPAPEPHQVENGTPRKQKTKYSSNPPIEHHIGWVIDAREHAVHASLDSLVETSAAVASQLSTSLGSTPQSLPSFEHPSHSLLKENGFTQLVYHKYRSKCLKDRKRLGIEV